VAMIDGRFSARSRKTAEARPHGAYVIVY